MNTLKPFCIKFTNKWQSFGWINRINEILMIIAIWMILLGNFIINLIWIHIFIFPIWKSLKVKIFWLIFVPYVTVIYICRVVAVIVYTITGVVDEVQQGYILFLTLVSSSFDLISFIRRVCMKTSCDRQIELRHSLSE